MNLIPNPLHPAVVHFPIVLLLLGAAFAVVAVFWRRHQVPVMAALLLTLGAVGTWAAVETGESDGGLLENGSPQLDALVDAHQTWAKRTLTISVVATVAAIGSALAGRWPRLARAVAVAAALAAAGAAYGIFETGHRGGALVYRHGAGVEVAGATPSGAAVMSSVAPAADGRPAPREHETN